MALRRARRGRPLRGVLLTLATIGLVCAHIFLAFVFALFFAASYPVFMFGSVVCGLFDRIKKTG